MKKLLCISFVFCVIYTNTLNAQNKTTAVTSAISGVTVFLSGAEVQRTGSLTLKGGAQQVVFENLPQNINPQSIQVSGVGNFTILGVSHRINYLRNADKTKEVITLEDSLKVLNEQITQQEATMAVLTDEQTMLKANQYIGGSNTGVKMIELKEFADYFRTRLTDLSKRTVQAQAAIKALKKYTERLEKQLRELQQRPQTPTSEIVVDITAQTNTKATLTASYLVYNAGWSPQYDLRSTELHKPVELTYKAQVYQSTGEAWDAVKPVFSTGNPTLNSTQPTLLPWYLSFYEPVQPRAAVNAFQKSMAPMAVKNEAIADHEVMMEQAGTTANFTTVSESQTSIEFAVDVPYTIESDGQRHTVELAKYTLPAKYEYYAVRKLEKDVFLLAKVTGWEKLNLLAGQANLFFEDKYVGQSYIETRQTDDTLALSLGRDKNITVTRIRKKDFAEKQILGNNVTETREWDLTVHNKKKQAVVLTLEDQAPVSTDKEIKVDLVNTSGAQVDAPTGKLTWRYVLNPSESRSVTVKYTVKHPKNRTVVLE